MKKWLSMAGKIHVAWAMTAILLAGVIAWRGLQTTDHGPAPAVSFVTLSGERLSLDSLRGHPVLVTFWSTNCRPCMDDMAHLTRMHSVLGAKGLKIIAVAMPYDPPNRVLEMARRQSIPYTVALDIQGKVVGAFGNVPGTPTTFLIGPDGSIASRTIGPLDPARLAERIREMIKTGSARRFPEVRAAPLAVAASTGNGTSSPGILRYYSRSGSPS